MVELPNLPEMESADTTTVLRLYNDKLTELLHNDDGMSQSEASQFMAIAHLMVAITAITHGATLDQLLAGQCRNYEIAKGAQA